MNGMENSLRLLTRLKNKRLHLGVTGSVACYKTAELLRLLLSCGIHVSATLTPSARSGAHRPSVAMPRQMALQIRLSGADFVMWFAMQVPSTA